VIEQILNRYEDIELIKADGFNDAIIGIDCENVRLVYSISKALAILQKHMDEEEAAEFFEFQVRQVYFGAKTPIWVEDNF